MSYDAELTLAKARDRHHDLDNEIYQNEVKLKKAQENIKAGLDLTGQIEEHAQCLTQKIELQYQQLQKMAEEIAVLETKV